jgi:hypothetical protein
MATLNKAVPAPKGKKITVKEAKAQAPKLIKEWGGLEYAAGIQQRIATSLLPPVIAMLRNANYTATSVKAKGDKATTADKAKAKALHAMVLASLPDNAQVDCKWVASYEGRKGNNSWKHAARLRGDSADRIVSISTNAKKPSEMLGKLEVGLTKAIAKEEAIAEGRPTNVKKTQLDILFGTIEKVHAKLEKKNDGYPEEFNDHRRKSMAVELKDLMAEIDELRTHTQKDGD